MKIKEIRPMKKSEYINKNKKTIINWMMCAKTFGIGKDDMYCLGIDCTKCQKQLPKSMANGRY